MKPVKGTVSGVHRAAPSGSKAEAGVVRGATEVTGDLKSIPQNCGPFPVGNGEHFKP